MELVNAPVYAKRYFGLHMAEGVCEYNDPNFTGRVLVLDPALNRLDPTFGGKPLFVLHVPKTTPEIAQQQGAGVVVRSFRNQWDGKRWVEFMATTADAIYKIDVLKWKLSNCYGDVERAPGGKWHEVEYDQQVMGGEYRHLALVPDPRYGESIILTPEEYAAYNSKLEADHDAQFANSQGASQMKSLLMMVAGKLQLFNSSTVSVDDAKKLESALEGTTIKLSSGKEMKFLDLYNAAEEKEKKGDDMANGEAMVDLGNGKRMTVNALAAAYNSAEEEKKKGDDEKQNAITAAVAVVQKKLDDAAAAHKTELANAITKATADATVEAKKKIDNFDELANAKAAAQAALAQRSTVTIDTPITQLARGMERYG